jgi:hypothetical protein
MLDFYMCGGILARLITTLITKIMLPQFGLTLTKHWGAWRYPVHVPPFSPKRTTSPAVAWQASHNVPSVCGHQVGHWRPNTNTSHTVAAANTQRIPLMSVGMVLLLDKSGYGQVKISKENRPFTVMQPEWKCGNPHPLQIVRSPGLKSNGTETYGKD